MTQTVVRKSTCCICNPLTNCGLDVHVQDGRIVGVEGSPETPGSRGHLCIKGRATAEFVHSPDRLLYPMKRVGPRGGGRWERISWDQALDTIAAELRKAKASHGAESTVFYVGYSKEVRPFLHRLAHAFGSPNYATESSTCMSATRVASALTVGEFGAPELARTRCLLNWSTNPAASNFIDDGAIREASDRGVKTIVVDPRRTPQAGRADLFLQIRPGTDGALALGMMQVIIGEGLCDREFVERWTVGFDELRELVSHYPPEEVERITRVPAERVVAAARLFATTKPAAIRTSACATVHHSNGVQNHRAIIVLSAITGNLDVPGGNVEIPPGYNEVRSGVPSADITLHNETISHLPPRVGQERFPVFCEHYHEGQGVALADQILTGKPYPIKAMLGIGMNLMMWPNSGRMAEALRALDFFVATDYFPTPTTALADLVLPAATSLERETLIHYRSGHIMWREAAIPPVGESWADWKLVFELAGRLGLGDRFWGGDLYRAFDEIMKPCGMTVERLREAGGPVLMPREIRYRKYEERGFKTPSGRVEIASSVLKSHGLDPLPSYREPVESPISSPELARRFPLVLTTGARKAAYLHSELRNVPSLRATAPHQEVDINPADADARRIRQGDEILLSTARGSVKMRAHLTDVVLPGVIHAPHGWAEADLNLITDDMALDPISGFPPF
ncbi:MAG: molybdopterin-containing oxidoreductase family protein, partial [Chloroflexota bacterium]